MPPSQTTTSPRRMLTLSICWLPFGKARNARLPHFVQSRPWGGTMLGAMITGSLLLLIPNPASLGVCRLAAVMQRKESPAWRMFWEATRENLGLGLSLFAIGLIGLVILVVNATFYLGAEPQALRALTVLWLYLGLFWLARLKEHIAVAGPA